MATARCDRLEAHIEAALPDWSLAPSGSRPTSAARCGSGRGGDGDRRTSRHHRPRQSPPAHLGLVPSEDSSGATRRQDGITKAGNSAAQRMLIEAAWSYRFPARISRDQLLRQEGLAMPILDTARKAQERLCRRYCKLARAGKSSVTTPVARELVGFGASKRPRRRAVLSPTSRRVNH